MTVWDRIKTYWKKPVCIWWDIEEVFARVRENHYQKLRQRIAKYDAKFAPSYRLNPIKIFFNELPNVYSTFTVNAMQIHGIQFDGNNKDEVSYIVYLKRPGYMIGLGGKLIDDFRKNLSKILHAKVEIRLIEIE
jgi:hypothetical protein